MITGTVLWNGSPLTTSGYSAGTNQELLAQVPASLLTTAGTATVTVTSTTSSPSTSSAVTVPIVNPPAPTLTGIFPNNGPINTAAQVTVEGTDHDLPRLEVQARTVSGDLRIERAAAVN